ncbi:MAG: VWA domain-containing protein [Clostridia bacterium]|nr:VWA domain-containing protein [Clostridia bacterium]MBO5480617.1 VWA domain-containing protein [Clostridia bacterium]
MTLLTPLGLLGLLGIAVLILIYIIKPNYQQKFISSTFVWKLSLKYRKKRIPISKLRNFLIILCQILILTAAALILAEPAQVLKNHVEEREVVVILDSSASMRTTLNGSDRFTRAVDGVIDLTDEVLKDNGIVSVIVADDKPEFLMERTTKEQAAILTDDLNDLISNDVCYYGTSDIEGAMALCEEVLEQNNRAKIYLYTDTMYSYVPENIEVVNVSVAEEWNAGILDAYTVLDENFYSFYVDVACYGRDEEVVVNVDVLGANALDSTDSGVSISFSQSVYCSREQTQRVVFINEDQHQFWDQETENVTYYPISEMDKIYSYQTVQITIQTYEKDSLMADDAFMIYNGQKEVVKIQYASADPNPFFGAMLKGLKGAYADRWDFQITEIKQGEEPILEGFDFYIFEHQSPKVLPTDGIVLLSDPLEIPSNIGLRFDGVYDNAGKSYEIAEDEEHAITSNMDVSDLMISRYVRLTYGAEWNSLITANGQTVFGIRDDEDMKVAVMGFSVHYSNIVITEQFAVLMYNLFGYFLPSTVESSAFEVNEIITLNARADSLYVTREGSTDEEKIFNNFPATMQVALPGNYLLEQTTFTGKLVQERIFVKTPALESNVWRVEDALENPYKEEDDTDYYRDLLLYIAAAMVAILFVEWWLQSRENM